MTHDHEVRCSVDAEEYLHVVLRGPSGAVDGIRVLDWIGGLLWPLLPRESEAIGWHSASGDTFKTRTWGRSPRASIQELYDARKRCCKVWLSTPRPGSSRPFTDYWTAAEYDESDEREASLQLSVRSSLLQHHIMLAKPQDGRLWPAIQEMVGHLCDSWRPYYGFVVTAHSAADDAGLVYKMWDVRCSAATVREDLDAARWRSLGETRRTLIRGIYWGQLLSPYHLEKLGGLARMRAGLDAALKTVLGDVKSEELLIEMPHGAAFLRLTLHPLNDSIYGLRATSAPVGLWFEREARKAGLLD